MSHFTRISIELRGKEQIKNALQQLGYKIKENAVLTGYGSQKTRADILAEKLGVAFGLCYQNGSYVLIADWYLNDEKEDTVISELKQQYAFVCVKEQVEKMYGYRIGDVAKDEKGNIRILVENCF